MADAVIFHNVISNSNIGDESSSIVFSRDLLIIPGLQEFESSNNEEARSN